MKRAGTYLRRVGVLLCAMIPCALFGSEVASCTGKSAMQRDRTLVIGRSSDAVTLDPAQSSNVADYAALRLLYQRLVTLDPKNDSSQPLVVGDLASTWETDSSGLQVTFTLHPRRRFSDGSPVNAEAVKYSFERMKAIGSVAGRSLQNVLNIDTPDSFHVIFQLKDQSPTFLLLLTLPLFSIVNPRVALQTHNNDAGGRWLAEHAAGSGAYGLVRWDRGARLILEANPYAQSPTVYFSRIEMVVLRDAVTRRLTFQRGDIDILEDLAPDGVATTAKLPYAHLLACDTAILLSLDMNNLRPPFDDQQVRLAVSNALDRKLIVHWIYRDQATAVFGLLPPKMNGDFEGTPSASTATVSLPPARIKQMREKAVTLSYVPGDSAIDALAVQVQSALATIGLSVNIERLSAAALGSRVAATGNYDMAIRAYLADFPDPSIVLVPLYQSDHWGTAGNRVRYANPTVDRLLVAAEKERNPPQRLRLFATAERAIMADTPSAVLLSPKQLFALRDDIKGFEYDMWLPRTYDVQRMYREARP
jgi:peptide/nickel transport system substrate-binding protein